MVDYVAFTPEFSSERLVGFHQDWVYKITPEKLHSMLSGSEFALLALEGEKVIGYIAVLGDGAVFAYISSLEVLEPYRGRGIGKELVRRVIAAYQDRYAVDLLCDETLLAFYEPLGMIPVRGACVRNYNAS
ncbi:MAG TPA: GNAT family N-acetyltransferase [Fimbriimonas sp.]|nr:GNAT family N-acetyltransferase [Fimbriimonas sp.]